MRVNSIQSQNYNKRQVRFGCDYCRLTRELLVDNGFVGHEVEVTLLRTNPKVLSPKIVRALQGSHITPEKLHAMRAELIYCMLDDIIKHPEKIFVPGIKLKQALKPDDGLENLIKAITHTMDDTLAIDGIVDLEREPEPKTNKIVQFIKDFSLI